MTSYLYELPNGRFLLGDRPQDDPHLTLYAAWPGDASDCPAEVARELLRRHL